MKARATTSRLQTHDFDPETDDRLRYIDQALAIDPDYAAAWAYATRGFSNWRRGNVAAATADFRQALALDSNEAGALSGLRLIQVLTDEPAAALEKFLKVKALDPRADLVYRQLHFAVLGLGDVAGAISCLEEGIERFPPGTLMASDLAGNQSLHATAGEQPGLRRLVGCLQRQTASLA